MSQPVGRRRLPHDPPPDLRHGPEEEVFFITVCCEPRGINQLAIPETWRALKESALHRESVGDWRITLLLAMPDHWHGLCAFPAKPMSKVVADFKSWLARNQGIRWQRDYFDHRLRSWESAVEKRRYILNNPHRAGLVEEAGSWPFVLDRLAQV